MLCSLKSKANMNNEMRYAPLPLHATKFKFTHRIFWSADTRPECVALLHKACKFSDHMVPGALIGLVTHANKRTSAQAWARNIRDSWEQFPLRDHQASIVSREYVHSEQPNAVACCRQSSASPSAIGARPSCACSHELHFVAKSISQCSCDPSDRRCVVACNHTMKYT